MNDKCIFQNLKPRNPRKLKAIFPDYTGTQKFMMRMGFQVIRRYPCYTFWQNLGNWLKTGTWYHGFKTMIMLFALLVVSGCLTWGHSTETRYDFKEMRFKTVDPSKPSESYWKDRK